MNGSWGAGEVWAIKSLFSASSSVNLNMGALKNALNPPIIEG
jgi:hypothetical protein